MKLSKSNKIRIFIWLLMLGGGLALGLYLDRLFFRNFLFNLWFHIASFILGFVVLKVVLRISKNTGRYLAAKGREGAIPRLQTNKLVTDGIYACMRHPMHFGLLFFPISIALLAGSISFILFIAPLEMVFMILMIFLVEEKEAIQKFGDAYRIYQKNTPFFSVKKECLKKLLQKR